MRNNSELGAATLGLLLMAGVMGLLDHSPRADGVAPAPPQDSPSVGNENPGKLQPPGSGSATPEPPSTTESTVDSGAESAAHAPSAPPESPPVDVSRFVHRILVNGTYGGSCVCIAPGVFATAKHIFNGVTLQSLAIDGRQVACNVQFGNADVAIVFSAGTPGSPAGVALGELEAGSQVLLYGMTTQQQQPGRVVESRPGETQVRVDGVGITQGDSGGGVFTEDGRCVGVISNFYGVESKGTADKTRAYFAPLQSVAALVAPFSPAAAGAHNPSAPPGAVSLSDFPSPCVLRFTADWCAACRSPEAADLARRLEAKKWTVIPVDVDDYPRLVKTLGITKIPTLVIVRGHEEYGRYTGTSWNAFVPVLKAAAEASSPSVVSASADAAAAPTPHAEVDRILSILKPQPSETFVDYGCGDGRFLIAAASQYGCRAVGVEIDPQRVREARAAVAAAGLSDRVEIIEGDVLSVDVNADVGVAYLYPDLLDAIGPKLRKLKRFASYLHPVGGLSMENWQGAYVWRQPALQQYGWWNGQAYSGRVCTQPGCRMCASIQSQISGWR